jgi:hypothetical protein
MIEEWKDIEGYEGLYQVSNLGRVKSLPREWIGGNGSIGRHNGMILRGGISTSGYPLVTLRKDGNKKTCNVHQLVATAFLNHEPCGMCLVVDHKDDNKTNNRVDNLQIVTNRFNSYKTQGKYSSKYKGVSWHKSSGKWAVAIRVKGKSKHLGTFDCELEAAHAYRKEVKNLTNCKINS